MSEIRNLTRNGETFYPLTTSSAVINEATGEGLIIDDEPTPGSDNLIKSRGVAETSEIVEEKIGKVYSGKTSTPNYSLISVNIAQGEKFSINAITTTTPRKFLVYNNSADNKLNGGDTAWDTDWINEYKEFIAPTNITSIGIHTSNEVLLKIRVLKDISKTLIKNNTIENNKLEIENLYKLTPFFNANISFAKRIKEFYIDGVGKTISAITLYQARFVSSYNEYVNILQINYNDGTEFNKQIYYSTQQEAINAFNSIIDFGGVYILCDKEVPIIELYNVSSGIISSAFFDINNSPCIKAMLIDEKYAGVSGAESSIHEIPNIGAFKYAKPTDFDYAQILVAGQSFAQGGSAGVGTTGIIPGCYMYGSDVKDIVAGKQINPLQESVYEFPVLSIVNALYKDYSRNGNNVKLLASTIGGGGISIRTFIDSYLSNYQTMATAIKAAADIENKSIGCAGIVWMQGESDYGGRDNSTPDKDAYKAYLLSVKNQLQQIAMTTYGQEYKPLFFVYQTSGRWITNYEDIDNLQLGVSMAQFELAQENDDVILISPVYQVTTYTDMHPARNGERWLGELYAKAMWQVFWKEKRFTNLKPANVYRNGKSIIVEVESPCLPLMFDTHTLPAKTNYGFEVYVNNTKVSISSVNISNNNIVITLVDDVADGATVAVIYGGVGMEGRGNVCDSDISGSWLLYLDESDDTGYDGTRTLWQIPTDKDGNSLVGKPYPMNNFLANFYIEIE